MEKPKMKTDTPRTDVCPNCGAESQGQTFSGKNTVFYCGAIIGETKNEQSRLCIERKARQKAQAEVERLKGIKQIKVSKRPYDYECGDGCCSEYGETWSVDGVEVAHGPCDDNRLQQLLKHLGYNASIVNENEDGEEVCEI